MRDDELRAALGGANPWWRAAASHTDPTAWTSSDRLLTDRATYDLGYRSTVLDDVATEQPSGRLVILTGPRRVGKSVVMLDTIAALCRKPDLDPRQIVHVVCDGMRARDLTRILTLGRALTASVDRPAPRPRLWFFDEVSGVSGWTSVLKRARDTSAFGDDTVVTTGSRWQSNEDVLGNLLAGRAGTAAGARLRQLLPMSFRDYLTATRPELPVPTPAHPAELQSPRVNQDLEALAFTVDAYDLAWQDYLTCGGFPRAVHEHYTTGLVSRPYAQDLVAWLRADVDPDAAPDSTLQLLSGLESRMTSPFNIATAVGPLGYPSRAILELRLTRLLNSHAILRCRQRDEHGRPVANTQAKLYLTDPVLAWLPSILTGLPTPDMTRLSEASLAVAQARAIDALDPGRWVADDTVGHARTGSGHEVDLAPVRTPTPTGPVLSVPIESKWVDDGWRGEATIMDKKYERGILATKSVLDTGRRTWAVPAPLVALLLG